MVITTKVVDDDSHACSIQHTFALFHRDWHFELKVHDEHGAILFDVLRCAGVENFALSLVRILRSQPKRAMIITRHVLSAEIVFDGVEFDGHHFQVATLDVTGDFEKRQLFDHL